jgi:hypothetical protein
MSKHTKLIHAGLALIAILSVGGEGRSQEDPCRLGLRRCAQSCAHSDSRLSCLSDCRDKVIKCEAGSD